jgi:hypothetical protein
VPPFLSSKANAPAGRDHYRPITQAVLEKLRRQSAARVKKASEFSEIEKELAEAKKNEGVVKLSELLKKSEDPKKSAKSEEDEDPEAERQKFEAKLAIVKHEAVNIVADLARP